MLVTSASSLVDWVTVVSLVLAGTTDQQRVRASWRPRRFRSCYAGWTTRCFGTNVEESRDRDGFSSQRADMPARKVASRSAHNLLPTLSPSTGLVVHTVQGYSVALQLVRTGRVLERLELTLALSAILRSATIDECSSPAAPHRTPQAARCALVLPNKQSNSS